jgi:hypothetical protein
MMTVVETTDPNFFANEKYRRTDVSYWVSEKEICPGTVFEEDGIRYAVTVLRSGAYCLRAASQTSPNAIMVLEAYRDLPSPTVLEVANYAGIPFSTTYMHVKRLVEAGKLAHNGCSHKRSRYYVTERGHACINGCE